MFSGFQAFKLELSRISVVIIVYIHSILLKCSEKVQLRTGAKDC